MSTTKFQKALGRLRSNEQTLEQQAAEAAANLQKARERREQVEQAHKKLWDARDYLQDRVESRTTNLRILKKRLAKAEDDVARYAAKLHGRDEAIRLGGAVAAIKESIQIAEAALVDTQERLIEASSVLEAFEQEHADLR